jgi:hypothetical protein
MSRVLVDPTCLGVITGHHFTCLGPHPFTTGVALAGLLAVVFSCEDAKQTLVGAFLGAWCA